MREDGFEITGLVIPDSVDSGDARDFLGMVEVRNAVAREQMGEDGAITPEELLPRVKRTAAGERFWALAKVDGRVVGRGICTLPFDDTAPEGDLVIEVLPDARRRGIGTALLGWALGIFRSRGKVVAQTREYMRPRDGVATITPSNGIGAIPADEPGAAFALFHGATLAQAERASVLTLPASDRVLDSLFGEAIDAAGTAYSIVRWSGKTPDQWEADIAALHTRMSTDAPQGDRTVTEDVWDNDRVRRDDSGWLDSGWQTFTSAALDAETGKLIGFTEIVTGLEEWQAVYQLETLVLREHRGHRLGMLMKIENIRALQTALPSCPRIITSNAAENEAMLRVNDALGFVPDHIAANWTLAL